jgi:hypothetical protein
MDRNAQRLELLPDYTFRHESTEVLYQQAHTVNLREREGIKTFSDKGI